MTTLDIQAANEFNADNLILNNPIEDAAFRELEEEARLDAQLDAIAEADKIRREHYPRLQRSLDFATSIEVINGIRIDYDA